MFVITLQKHLCKVKIAAFSFTMCLFLRQHVSAHQNINKHIQVVREPESLKADLAEMA